MIWSVGLSRVFDLSTALHASVPEQELVFSSLSNRFGYFEEGLRSVTEKYLFGRENRFFTDAFLDSLAVGENGLVMGPLSLAYLRARG